MKGLWIILLCAASCMGANAAVWSLDSCISYAATHNLNVQSARLQVENARDNLTASRSAFLPTADASAGQNFNFGRGLTAQNTYAERNTTNFQWGASLSLPLFQYANIERVKAARESIRQMVLQCDATCDNLTLNIISQYMQTLFCKEVEKSAQTQLGLSEYQVNRVRSLVEAGKLAEAELYDTESQAARDRLAVVNAQGDTRTALVQLANMLQLREVDDFDIAPLTDEQPLIARPEQIFRDACTVNNSLMAARQSVAVAQRNIAVAKAGYLPTLGFNAGLGSSYYRLGGMQNETFGQQMRHNYSTYLGFTLRIPLFDGLSTRNNVRSARLSHRNAMLEADRAETELFTSIQLAYTQAISAREKYLTSETTLDKARLSFDATRERYDLGRATATDFEQAKTNLFNTEISRIQALYEYQLRFRMLQFYQLGHTL